jgi:hypothetical protein
VHRDDDLHPIVCDRHLAALAAASLLRRADEQFQRAAAMCLAVISAPVRCAAALVLASALMGDGEVYAVLVPRRVEHHVVEPDGRLGLEEYLGALRFDHLVLRLWRRGDLDLQRLDVGRSSREEHPQSGIARCDLVNGVDGALRELEHDVLPSFRMR